MKRQKEIQKLKKLRTLRQAFIETIPVLFGYVFMGAAFGALLASKGYSFWWAALMSIVIYAGSMQFVAINLLTSIFNPIAAVIVTLLVQFRHIFYGLSLFEKFDQTKQLKPYMIFSLTDETFSLLCSKKPKRKGEEKWFYFFIAALNHLYWILGCTLGAVARMLIKFNSKGIDFAMTALFIVIFIEQWENTNKHSSAILGVFVASTSLILFGEKNFLVPAMLLLVITLLFQKHFSDKKAKEREKK